MSKFEQVLTDVKEILLATPGINKVELGRHLNVEQEKTFTAVYILPDTDVFELKRLGTGISAYDNKFYVRLLVNINSTEDEFLWIQTREDIINAILYDTEIWNGVIDRDIVSIVYDDYASMPKSSMEILFEFIVREDCPV